VASKKTISFIVFQKLINIPMSQPIISIDRNNLYKSGSFYDALVLRYNQVDSPVIRAINMTPRIFIWTSPSYHLIYKRSPTASFAASLKNKGSDIYETTVFTPNLDTVKYKNTILVPKNSIIIGCFFPSRNDSGLVQNIVYEATVKQIEGTILHSGNDLLLDRNKFCGIEEVYSKGELVVAAVITVEFSQYKDIFEKFLQPREIIKNNRSICGLKDIYPAFNVDQYVEDISNLFAENLS
jgi:hypothetical protein